MENQAVPSWPALTQMLTGENLGFIATRTTKGTWDCGVTNMVMGHKSLAAYDPNSLFFDGNAGMISYAVFAISAGIERSSRLQISNVSLRRLEKSKLAWMRSFLFKDSSANASTKP